MNSELFCELLSIASALHQRGMGDLAYQLDGINAKLYVNARDVLNIYAENIEDVDITEDVDL